MGHLRTDAWTPRAKKPTSSWTLSSARWRRCFPDPYFHIGGDEVEDAQWKQFAAIQAFAREHHLADSLELQAYFNQRVQKLLKKHGKIMIGWDEVLAPGLASDTVIQSWRGQESLAEAARKGYRGDAFVRLLPGSSEAGRESTTPTIRWTAARALDADQSARILGGEACMWYRIREPGDGGFAHLAEHGGHRRALLVAARGRRIRGSMYARLEAVSRALEWTGLAHRSNYQPMLDRLAGAGPVEPLRVLADACEALGIEGRRDARNYTSLVRSESVRGCGAAGERAGAQAGAGGARTDPADLAALRATMRAWAENEARLAAAADRQ